jgi:hypothetical protein
LESSQKELADLESEENEMEQWISFCKTNMSELAEDEQKSKYTYVTEEDLRALLASFAIDDEEETVHTTFEETARFQVPQSKLDISFRQQNKHRGNKIPPAFLVIQVSKGTTLEVPPFEEEEEDHSSNLILKSHNSQKGNQKKTPLEAADDFVSFVKEEEELQPEASYLSRTYKNNVQVTEEKKEEEDAVDDDYLLRPREAEERPLNKTSPRTHSFSTNIKPHRLLIKSPSQISTFVVSENN